jgi:hypothetical protein
VPPKQLDWLDHGLMAAPYILELDGLKWTSARFDDAYVKGGTFNRSTVDISEMIRCMRVLGSLWRCLCMMGFIAQLHACRLV